MYLYVISDGEFCKIGISKNPAKRLMNLQGGNARKLNLVCTYRSDEYSHEIEKFCHDQLIIDRLSGEWFDVYVSAVDDCVHLFYSSYCWHERDIPKACIYNADDELGLPYPDPTSPEYYSPPLLERKENEN